MSEIAEALAQAQRGFEAALRRGLGLPSVAPLSPEEDTSGVQKRVGLHDHRAVTTTGIIRALGEFFDSAPTRCSTCEAVPPLLAVKLAKRGEEFKVLAFEFTTNLWTRVTNGGDEKLICPSCSERLGVTREDLEPSSRRPA